MLNFSYTITKDFLMLGFLQKQIMTNNQRTQYKRSAANLYATYTSVHFLQYLSHSVLYVQDYIR